MIYPLLLLCAGTTVLADHIINNAKEFIKFSNSVNSGTNYSGTTVYLGADIDFIDDGYGDTFYPIGYNVGKVFSGTFDGNGYAISNFRLGLSFYEYVGLFAYSSGATIRNLVMDSTAHFDNYRANKIDSIVASGVICHCNAVKGPCVIENVVNMAQVAFSGSLSSATPVYVAGIAGRLSLDSSYDARITNCVNYGAISHEGPTQGNAYLGGIVGYVQGSSKSGDGVLSIRNSASYGTITNTGYSKSARIGGIAGEAQYAEFEDCLSGGKINSTVQGENMACVVGSADNSVSATRCMWTANVGYAKASGGSGAVVSQSVQVELDEDTLADFNDNVEAATYAYTLSPWVALNLSDGRICDVDSEIVITTLNVFATPVKEGFEFLYWCVDAKCSEKYNSSNTTNITNLYAKYEEVDYTVTFNFTNGTVIERTLNFGDNIVYPAYTDVEKYFFYGWDPAFDVMPAKNTVINARWLPIERWVSLTLGTVTVDEAEYEKTIAKYATAGAYDIEDFDVLKDEVVTNVVIRFTNIKEAEKFAKGIQKSADWDTIKDISFLSEYRSFAISFQPLWFIISLF